MTEIINIHNPNGEYTVANVRAAQGNILGGSSAGWILVVINENPKESIKRIVTYDGLTAIDKNDKKLIFKGFVTPKENEFSTRLFGAAIEGDFNTTGDKVSIYTPKKGERNNFYQVFSEVRIIFLIAVSPLMQQHSTTEIRQAKTRWALMFLTFKLKTLTHR